MPNIITCSYLMKVYLGGMDRRFLSFNPQPIIWALMGLLYAGTPKVEADPIKVVATTSLVADLVREVGGHRLEVQALMGPGVDPHLYKPSAGDIMRLSRAKIVFYHGLSLEGKMGDLFRRLEQQGRSTHAITRSLSSEDLIHSQASPSHPDPHVWGDPRLWKHCVTEVSQTLAQMDPEGAAYYEKAANTYRQSLDEWFAWGRSLIEQIDASRRVLITSHDAFNYFGNAFGLKVLGVQGISTSSEAPLADIIHLVDFIRQRSIPAVFVESSVSPTLIRRISEDAGVKVGGELFSDALGESGKMGTHAGKSYDLGTYKGWLGHNLSTIARALTDPK